MDEYGENRHLIYRFRAGQLADLVGLGDFGSLGKIIDKHPVLCMCSIDKDSRQ